MVSFIVIVMEERLAVPGEGEPVAWTPLLSS
jgi:hypothetical protein